MEYEDKDSDTIRITQADYEFCCEVWRELAEKALEHGVVAWANNHTPEAPKRGS